MKIKTDHYVHINAKTTIIQMDDHFAISNDKAVLINYFIMPIYVNLDVLDPILLK